LKHLSDEQILAFLDNQLLIAEKSQVQSHLKTCADCRQEFAQYKTLFTELEKDPGFELAPEFTDHVIRYIEKKSVGNLQEKLFTLFLLFAGVIAAVTTSLYFVDFETIWTDMKIDGPTINTQSFYQWLDFAKTFIPDVNFNYSIIIIGGLVLFFLAAFDRLLLQSRFKIAAK
jgi:hypothetical protein